VLTPQSSLQKWFCSVGIRIFQKKGKHVGLKGVPTARHLREQKSDPVTQNVQTQNAPNDVPLRRADSKDLSLVSLVPKWSGGETALPIIEFFEIIKDSAVI